ncbi:AsmA family protein [Pragia fontium]|uniref:AsmA family protein n=1 Tax=Pragia fontium DSM 5563 = ATCC 49100 TaxID=1122977 RepID=A0AAJ5BII8_9GAMM|nr:AsmA family protein [Pragia fontium]SFD39025.1 AsmA family protein [Pragia fontium DSM 5563 = ATCC 49100]
MRFIRKSLYTLLCLLVLAVIIIYFVAQTSYAAKWISQWVNDNSPYQLSLGNLDYSITEPSQLILHNVELSQQKQPTLLKAEKVTLGLTSSLWQPKLHFSTLELENGTLSLSAKTAISLAVSSDRFQLRNMAVNLETPDITLQGERVNGGIIPWVLSADPLPDSDNHFEFSADKLLLNGIETHKALIQGDVDNQQIIFNNVGADLANGLLTGSGKRNAEGHWIVDNLRLSDVKYQSQQTLSQLFEQIEQLTGHTDITLNRLDLLNANIQGTDWAFSDLSLSVKDLMLVKGNWQAQSGTINMNAYDVVYGNQHLVSPVLNLGLEDNNVKIKQFSSRWQDGLVRASGIWQQDSQALTLDDVALTSLLYTLPKDWLTELKQTPPNWLRELHITKFTTNRSILIDINPEFPFQFTALDSNGSDLYLIKDHQFGIWGGQLSFNASEATLNKIDLRHPSVILTATPEAITVSEMSAFTKEGLIEGKVTLGQQPERTLNLALSGRSVPVNILQSWGWQSIPLQGNGNINLQLSGNLVDRQTSDSKLKGSLKMVNDTGQMLTQYPLSQVEIPVEPDISVPEVPNSEEETPATTPEVPQESPFG